MDGLSVECQKPDSRPVVVLDDVKHAMLRGIDESCKSVTSSEVVTYDCSDVRVMG